jgi:histidinol-phosphate aminotransferase
MSAPFAKSTIAAIRPYVAGKARAEGFARPIKLSANENALGCSPAARAAFLESAEALNRYADPYAGALREAVAQRHALEPARLVFGAGSDEIFSLACQAYLGVGDEMVQPQFAFAAWAIAARAAGANVVSAPERNDTVDVDALIAAVTPRTRMLFVANPASPTGTRVPFAEIERLHAALPLRVLLVLDGAYAEFAEAEADFHDGMRLAKSAPNVLVTRTFSKIHGLAALRIGWGYSSAAIADTLNRIRLPFNVPAPSQAAACAALTDEAFIARSALHAREGRADLARFLMRFGFQVAPPSANFVTARTPRAFPVQADVIEQALAARGILVRGLSTYAMPDALRITIGADHEMASLRTALNDILNA